MHSKKAKCLLHLKYDCNAIIEKHVSLPCLHAIYRANLWSAIAGGTKEYTCSTNWWMIIFIYFLEYWLKSILLGILSMQCIIRRDRPSETRQSICWLPLDISVFQLHFFWLEFWTFFLILRFYAVILCLKTVRVCSFCKLHSFTIFSTVIYFQCYKMFCFILPTDWMLELFYH